MEQLKTSNFGVVEYADGDVLEVKDGLPGFRDLRRFVLIDNPEFEPLKFLQSVENPVISFPMIDPRALRSDYQVALKPDDQSALGLDEESPSLVYAIVTLGAQPDESTANLFSPLVINPARMLAIQVFLTQSEYSVTEPLLGPE